MLISFLKNCPGCGYKFGSIGAMGAFLPEDGSMTIQYPICKKCLMYIRRGNSNKIIHAIEEALQLQYSESAIRKPL